MGNPETSQLDFGDDEGTNQHKVPAPKSRAIQTPMTEDQPKRTKIVRDPSDGSTYEVPIDR